MEEGKHETSFLSKHLESKELDPEEAFVLKWTTMALYGAGADTVRIRHLENTIKQINLTLADRVINGMLFLSNDSIPLRPTQSARRTRSSYRSQPASRIPRPREPPLYKCRSKRSASLASCCAHGFATHDHRR